MGDIDLEDILGDLFGGGFSSFSGFGRGSKSSNRARKGEGPTLLEFRTWRRYGHWEGDPDIRLFTYRNKEEHEAWLNKDPIPKYRNDLINGGTASSEELDAIDSKVDGEIKAAIEFAENSPYPDVSILTQDVYA